MTPRSLRLLVMHVSARCDQACVHCSIWKSNGRVEGELSDGERLAVIREARALGARAVLFTGGEPFLCDHIETLARAAKSIGLSVQIASNGLGLSRAAVWLGGVVDEVYVSVDGPTEIHDGLRGSGMLARLKASVADVLALSIRPRLIARSTLSARNASAIEETVRAARDLGVDGVSFLGVDVLSGAFGGDPASRADLRPSTLDVAALRQGIARLGRAGDLGGFVIEDERKLATMAEAFLRVDRAHEAPDCNAPEWSSVVEADGTLRPCFFQPPVGRVRGTSLRELRTSVLYATALDRLGEGNRTCMSCVCPKHRAGTLDQARSIVRRVLGGALPQSRSYGGGVRL